MPDGIHLHSLIYRRVMRWAVGDRSAKALTRRNSMTSPYLWAAVHVLGPAGHVLFWDNTAVLAMTSWACSPSLRRPVLAHRALQVAALAASFGPARRARGGG
jgi:hypothetical protein